MPELVKDHLNDSHNGNKPFNPLIKNDFQDYWNGGIPGAMPFISITEQKENYCIEMIAPGLKKNDFDVEVGRNLVTLSCETVLFYRSFIIPEDADADGITAKYNHGVLNLSIPKKQEIQKNKIYKITVE